MNKWILLVIVGVFISSLSQVLLKKSSMEKHENIFFEYLNFKVIVGYFLFFIAILFSIISMKKGVEAKEIPILDSFNYIFIIIWSIIIFKEKLNLKKILGLFFIVLGIIIFYL